MDAGQNCGDSFKNGGFVFLQKVAGRIKRAASRTLTAH